MKHFRLFAILLLLVCGWTTVAHGQTQEPAINLEFTDIPLSEAISRIEKSSKYTFFYDAKQTDLTRRVSLRAKQLPISAALRQMLAPTGLNFTISERQIALIPAARKAPAGSRTITGTVNDSHELPLAGVAVTLEGDNTRGTVSENNGSFTITVPDTDAVLSFTYLGYISKKVSVPVSQNSLKVFLAEDAVRMEDVVVVGYGTQKKASLTGAISAINNEEIITTKNENVQNMLTGKVAGLRVRQNSSEPGQFNTSMDIRGFGAPLIVIDGVPRDNMARLDPEDIEQVSVLKDASAAIYGVKGGNGVVLITTKKGDKGRVNINYSGNISWQRPSNFPDLVDAADWMTLYNEKYTMHSVDNMSPVPQYSQEDIAAYRNGEKKSYNWKDAVFRNSAPQTQHTVSASGGNDKVTFYTSLGYQYQESFLQHTPITYDKYTLRANINAKIAKNLTLDVNLA